MPNVLTNNRTAQQYENGIFITRTVRTAVPTSNDPQVFIGPLSIGTTEIGNIGDIIHTGDLRTAGVANIGRDLSVGKELTVVGNIVGFNNVVMRGNVTAFYSDERLKVKIGEIDHALDKIDTLTPFYYHANKTAEDLGYDPTIREIGLSAQEVQAIMPEVVAPAPADANYLTIRYEKLVPLLVEAIKELRAEVNALKQKIGE